MNSLDNLSLLQVLNELRPSDILKLGIVDRVHNVLTKDPLTRYRLLKRWCPTDKTIEELQQYVPNITLQQISVLADYYYPTKDSIGEYHLDELFYNACKAGYSIEDCMWFVSSNYDPVIPIVTGREDILELWKEQYKAYDLFNGKYSEGYVNMLLHRDMTVELWVDTIIKYGINERYLERLLNYSPPIVRRTSEGVIGYRLPQNHNHPAIIRLAKHFNIILLDNKANIEVSPASIILKYKLDMENNDMNAKRILSSYDSAKFPSYDIFDDICSGNYLEVIHKANTWDRDILVYPGISLLGSMQGQYISHTGGHHDTYAPICKKYTTTRLETVGQCVLYMGSEDANEYLYVRELALLRKPLISTNTPTRRRIFMPSK